MKGDFNMKYLDENIRTLEELKKTYHRWCLKLHPDVGGRDAEMKILNAEYERLFERVKNIHVNKDGEQYEKDTEETPEMFHDLIDALMKLADIEIEIIGCFVWVSGETKQHKEKLKELGFRWHSKKNVGINPQRGTADGAVVSTVWMTSVECMIV